MHFVINHSRHVIGINHDAHVIHDKRAEALCHMLSATRFELLQQLLRGECVHTNEHHVLQRSCVIDVTTNEVHGNLSKGHDVLRTEKQARRLHDKRAECPDVV